MYSIVICLHCQTAWSTVYPKKYAHGFCFVVVIHWLIFPYPSGLLHWHCGNLTITPVPAKHPWWIWISTSCEISINDCITTTKQSTTKPCAYFLGYTVFNRYLSCIARQHGLGWHSADETDLNKRIVLQWPKHASPWQQIISWCASEKWHAIDIK